MIKESIAQFGNNGFNRSILKCKSSILSTRPEGYLGLIEAYWNVNIDISAIRVPSTFGLIEAYWNVNNISEAIKVLEAWV